MFWRDDSRCKNNHKLFFYSERRRREPIVCERRLHVKHDT